MDPTMIAIIRCLLFFRSNNVTQVRIIASNQSLLINNQTGSNNSYKRKHTVTNIKIKEDNKMYNNWFIGSRDIKK